MGKGDDGHQPLRIPLLQINLHLLGKAHTDEANLAPWFKNTKSLLKEVSNILRREAVDHVGRINDVNALARKGPPTMGIDIANRVGVQEVPKLLRSFPHQS